MEGRLSQVYVEYWETGMKEYEAHRKSEDTLKKAVDAIYKEKDTDAAVEKVLSIVAKFYGADRCYIYEYFSDASVYRNTYEWLSEGVESFMKEAGILPASDMKILLKDFAEEGEVWIASAADEVDEDSQMYKVFLNHRVNSVLLAPVRESKVIIGFLGLDNPTKNLDDSFLLRAVTVIMYSEVVRRRQTRLQEREAEKQKRQLDLDKSIIEVLADEYISAFYIDLDTDVISVIRTSDAMIARFGELYRENVGFSTSYRIFVNGVVHPDDKEEMFIAGSPDFIKETLRHENNCVRKFRCFINGIEEIYEMKFVKVGKPNARPQIIVIGIANREKETREEQNRQIELVEANRKAEEASRAKSTFLFNMSHDIRTPMNAIIGYTEMAEQYSKDPKKQAECFGKLKIASRQLLGLVNDVLDMARIENGKIVIEEMPNDIVICTNNSFQVLKQGADGKKLNMTVEYRGIEHNRVYCDELRLNRIFTNIISNSVKYTKPGGEVHFIVEELQAKRPGYARFKFTVTDTGIGMSEDFLTHVYDAFAREHSTTASGIEGTGLGMSITKELVDMMGGTLDIKSELGIGTIVTARIDFRISDEEVERVKEEEVISWEALEYKRVLLVEDNEMNREIARNLLESRGLIVEEATDGSVAVEMVLAKTPDYYDYVLMDVQMPYMDGYKATMTIRSFADSRYSTLPIIAMTANAFEEDKKKALMSGMDAHLAKPINVKELFRVLQRFVGV